MSHKSDLTAVTRISTLFLLAALVVAFSGCAGWRVDDDLVGPSRLVTGNYRGNETLAVLLPKSGRFAQAAEVVRAGIVAAQAADPQEKSGRFAQAAEVVRAGIVAAQAADPQEKRPELRFYDSTSRPIDMLVWQAATDGASLAIGPLQKPMVAKLGGSTVLPIPVLALNRAVTVRSPNLYQFSLAPEGEAAEVAAKAWGKGHRRTVVLYPENKWGTRVSHAFYRSWKVRGGSVVALQAFDPSATHFADMIRKLSKQAAGADFVFLVANAELARRIWPLIRNKIGGTVPVYATSHVYNGRLDPERDRHLLGLNFVEIPWLVEPTRGDAVSPAGLNGKLPRLYAMGVDAYRLASRLDWLSGNPRARVQGKTGILSMDSLRRIHRKLALARINAVSPTKLVLIKQGRLED